MADWAEIRQLQADLQRVQSSSTAQRLSERNCVELVTKLMDMKLLEVIYTLDGKEYIIPQHLEREIKDELIVHRGRVNVVELQQILNVDLNHIEKGVANLLKRDSTLQLVQGDLISREYKDELCREVNERLQQSGHVAVAELSKQFSLPLNFITECIEGSLGGKLLQGQLDKTGGGLLYTNAYVARHKARIRGLFSAITRPTPVAPLISQGKYHERLFHTVLSELIHDEELVGAQYGRADKAVYIPAIFTQMQNQWVDTFLASNGYLEYDALARLGIEEVKGYIKRRFSGGKVVPLSSCCVGQSVLAEIEGAIEEAIDSKSWVDIQPLLPSPCTVKDAHLLLQELCGKKKEHIVTGSILITKEYLQHCVEVFKPVLTERAQKAIANSSAFLKQVSHEEPSMSHSSEGKKSKKERRAKGRRQQQEASEAPVPGWNLIFMSQEEMEDFIQTKFEYVPQEFAVILAEQLSPQLNDKFQQEARELLAAQTEGEAGAMRKKHSQLREQIQGLWCRARLFDKGAQLFQGETQAQVIKYLLKTLCTDMTNSVVNYLIGSGPSLDLSANPEVVAKKRVKAINEQIDEEMKKIATTVNTSLTGKETGPFFDQFQDLCSQDSVGILLKKIDKRKEKELLSFHLHSLKESLEGEQDPAMMLHLVTVILFQQQTHCMVHIPGRLVPQVTAFLVDHLSEEEHGKLIHYQELVVQQLKLSTKQDNSRKQEREDTTNEEATAREEEEEEEDELGQVSRELRDMLTDIKGLVTKPPTNQASN